MSRESELMELERVEKINGCKVKYFIGDTRQVVENKFKRYVNRHKVNISLLVCRKSRKRFLYALWY
jgi:hypothetical protein